MRIAINQPFFFPYIGFFQLIYNVDKFILYDDVNYMKNSWINRNRILINKNPHYFTIPLQKPSSFKTIKEINILNDFKKHDKILKTLTQVYTKAPYFDEVIRIIDNVFLKMQTEKCIARIGYYSIRGVSEYLGFEKSFEFSSERYPETKGLGRKERLYKILEMNKATDYINLPGGVNLYSKEDFKKHGYNLYFIDRGIIEYKQFDNEVFVPLLSIIDVLMFNSIDETIALIKKGSLI